jgi:hypothetical protein
VKAPELKPFATLKVEIAPAQEIGATQFGQRRVIPITGGTVSGDGWSGKVLPGGADFQLILSPRLFELDARYVIETDEGETIFIQNRAVRAASEEATAKIINGQPVDPSEVYFRCTPTLETASERFSWVTERLFIGTGIRRPDCVELQFFEVC